MVSTALDNRNSRIPSTPHNGAGGCLVTNDGRTLPLTHAGLEAEAAGGIARVTLEQRFRNTYAEPLQVRYLLPLPEDGAVSGFAFRIGETRIVGEVDKKAAARERFEAAVASGRTAAILEQVRGSVFDQEVGNIPPGEEVVVEIEIDQPLEWLDIGAWRWRFPTVVGPRYTGAAGRVPDAGALAVEVSTTPRAVTMTLALSIADALTGAATSTSHGVQSSSRDGETDVRFDGDRGVRLDRDVVVEWPVAKLETGVSLSTARPSDAGHGDAAYGLITLVPPTVETDAVPRDLIVLLDVSGSMSGRPLAQAKRVVQAMIDGLGKKDRLEMIAFAMRPDRWTKEPVLMTKSGKRTASSWLKKLRAGGGTEMHTAIVEALRPLRDGAQRQVLLLTDGYIGFEQEVIAAIANDMPRSCRLHTVGIGSSVNRSLTKPAARVGAGVEVIVDLDEDAERSAKRLLARTHAPLVTEMTIEGPALREAALQQLPDLYARGPALLLAAVQPDGGALTVRGTTAAGPFEHTLDVPATSLGEGNQGIAALFGREQVADLEAWRAGGSDVDERVEALGLRFQIATRLTSWVAIRDEVSVQPGTPSRFENVLHELPYGTSVEGLGLRAAAPMAMASPGIAAPGMFEVAAQMIAGAPPTARKARGGGAPSRARMRKEAFDSYDAEDEAPEELDLGAAMDREITGSFGVPELADDAGMFVADDEDIDALDEAASIGDFAVPAAAPYSGWPPPGAAPKSAPPAEPAPPAELAERSKQEVPEPEASPVAPPAVAAEAPALGAADGDPAELPRKGGHPSEERVTPAPPPSVPQAAPMEQAAPEPAASVTVAEAEASRLRWVVAIVLVLLALLAALAIWYPVSAETPSDAPTKAPVESTIER